MKLLRLPKKSKVLNASGAQVFYGQHIYPGVAEYRPDTGDMYRLLLTGKTLRDMDPTYQGRPVFVLHNTEYSEVLNRLKGEADGWVIRSFYNEADGTHWAEFIIHSERGLEAIRNGFGLSNCYHRTNTNESGGVHNGVEYDKEVLAAEYDHLALVPDPRYTTKIMTPKEFQRYNEEKRTELRRVANSKDKGKSMGKGLQIFTRTKVQNSKELEDKEVLLEKSGVSKTVKELALIADKFIMNSKKPRVVNAEDIVEIEDAEGQKGEVTVKELLSLIQTLEEKVESLESAAETMVGNEDDEGMEDDEETEENEDDDKEDDEDTEENEKDCEENSEDAPGRIFRVGNSLSSRMKPKGGKGKPDPKKKVQNSQPKPAKDPKAKKKADAIRNAADSRDDRVADHFLTVPVQTSISQLSRGKSLYGSSKGNGSMD